MAFNIEIVQVKVENKGKYREANVQHKLDDGKVDNRKVMSFGAGKGVFTTLSVAQQGDRFEIEAQKIKNEKDGKEYWTWVTANPVGKSGTSTPNKVAQSGRSSFETPEERAARQVYIVRQSSIANAIEYLKQPSIASTKTGFTEEDVIRVAKQFEDYVFNGSGNQPIVQESEVK